jgi:hypothetical protein
MAVLVIAQVQGGDAALDARITQELGLQNAPAPGSLARFAGPTDTGWRVITVWESEEAYRTFEREKLMPAFQRLGVTPPTIQVSPLDSVRIAPTGSAQTTR